ncbi:hypothetical protein [Actinomadura fulvescens]|uniref:Uncharacterized protein n=1 Tax=Actinomadura fulvescens TaxID=46160 RepID=A0ABN3PG72_9ACTN
MLHPGDERAALVEQVGGDQPLAWRGPADQHIGVDERSDRAAVPGEQLRPGCALGARGRPVRRGAGQPDQITQPRPGVGQRPGRQRVDGHATTAHATTAAAAAFAHGPGARAATGTFFYTSPDSGPLEIEDPDNGECRLLLQGATDARNSTDTAATLYVDHTCEEPMNVVMGPGQSRTFTAPPHSVTFG